MFCGLMEGVLLKALKVWGQSRAKEVGLDGDDGANEDAEWKEQEDCGMDAEGVTGKSKSWLSMNVIEALKMFRAFTSSHMMFVLISLHVFHFIACCVSWIETV